MSIIPYLTEEDFRKYVGIDFHHGSTDCFGLWQRVYKEMFHIEIKDYARPDFWWEQPELYNLYMDNMPNEGFYLIDSDNTKDWEVGDIILMAIHSVVPCHAAMWIGNGKILHHFYGRRSSIENYCRIWKNTTVAAFRHKDLNFEKTEERMDLSDDPRIKSFILLQQERSRTRGNNNKDGITGV